MPFAGPVAYCEPLGSPFGAPAGPCDPLAAAAAPLPPSATVARVARAAAAGPEGAAAAGDLRAPFAAAQAAPGAFAPAAAAPGGAPCADRTPPKRVSFGHARVVGRADEMDRTPVPPARLSIGEYLDVRAAWPTPPQNLSPESAPEAWRRWRNHWGRAAPMQLQAGGWANEFLRMGSTV